MPVSYTNRRGDTYYLHVGKTKTGKPRYFVARTIGDGALDKLPAGFEIVESINAVVSTRRIDPNAKTIPDQDLERVRAELAKHPHLRRHRAEAVKGEILVFQPIGGMDDETASRILATFQMTPAQLAAQRARLEEHVQYDPVLRFVPVNGGYDVRRMTYTGRGGWSYALDQGPIARLATKYVKKIGTDAFFELH